MVLVRTEPEPVQHQREPRRHGVVRRLVDEHHVVLAHGHPEADEAPAHLLKLALGGVEPLRQLADGPRALVRPVAERDVGRHGCLLLAAKMVRGKGTVARRRPGGDARVPNAKGTAKIRPTATSGRAGSTTAKAVSTCASRWGLPKYRGAVASCCMNSGHVPWMAGEKTWASRSGRARSATSWSMVRFSCGAPGGSALGGSAAGRARHCKGGRGGSIGAGSGSGPGLGGRSPGKGEGKGSGKGVGGPVGGMGCCGATALHSPRDRGRGHHAGRLTPRAADPRTRSIPSGPPPRSASDYGHWRHRLCRGVWRPARSSG